MDVIEEEVVIQGELNPESLLEWLSVVHEGKKTVTKRSDLSFRVKKHLSALGWTFFRGKKRELRYKSPSGRWYYSLATACKAACVHQQHKPHQQLQQQSMSFSPRNRDEFNQKQRNDEEIYRGEDCDIVGLTLNEENPISDSIQIVDISNHQPKRKRLNSCDKGLTSDEENPSSNSIKICIVEDCDIAGSSTPNEENHSPDAIKIIPNIDIVGSLTPNEENPSSDSIKIIPKSAISNNELKRKRLKSCDTKSSTSDEENSLAILSCCGVSKNSEPVKDCDTPAFNRETPNEQKNPSSDSIRIIPKSAISNNELKRKRLKSCDTKGSSSDEENPLAILPCFGVSKQQPEKTNSEGVMDCDTAVFNRETPSEEKSRSEIVPNVDIPNQKQKKKRSKRTNAFNRSTPNDEDKAERKPGKGKSLKNILRTMKKKENIVKESVRFCRKDSGPDTNCEVCCICYCGEDLIRCDGCPSSFHLTCLGLSSLPKEKLWFCPCCCCDTCGSMESPGNGMVMICDQCQRRFHLNCLEEEPYIVSCTHWFCSRQCNKVYGKLQSLLGCGIAVGDGDLVWRLMRAPSEDEHYDDEKISKLKSAVEILHQILEPTEDPLSWTEFVEELIFTKDGNGAAYGFYMVLIEKNNKPVMIAALRVDKDLAEIPLVATLPNYRTFEMCKVLMDELEKQMAEMGVRRLIIPIAEQGLASWTKQFGFSVMESAERLEFVKHGIMDFVDTVLCHKFIK